MLISFCGKKTIACFEISQTFLLRWVKYLEQRLNGESPANYFKKIKQIINAAEDDGLFRKNPAAGIKVKKQEFARKEVLSIDDITALYHTPLSNDLVKRAFLFCCYTGLRYCDVISIKWENVKDETLIFVQKKTKVTTTITLNPVAKSLLGDKGKNNELIFALPSHTACIKHLKNWAAAANIDKKVTFHCARHSFGTNLIAYGVDISIASKLLGHTSLTHTQRYVRISEELKASAINKLPVILT